MYVLRRDAASVGVAGPWHARCCVAPHPTAYNCQPRSRFVRRGVHHRRRRRRPRSAARQSEDAHAAGRGDGDGAAGRTGQVRRPQPATATATARPHAPAGAPRLRCVQRERWRARAPATTGHAVFRTRRPPAAAASRRARRRWPVRETRPRGGAARRPPAWRRSAPRGRGRRRSAWRRRSGGSGSWWSPRAACSCAWSWTRSARAPRARRPSWARPGRLRRRRSSGSPLQWQLLMIRRSRPRCVARRRRPRREGEPTPARAVTPRARPTCRSPARVADCHAAVRAAGTGPAAAAAARTRGCHCRGGSRAGARCGVRGAR